MPSEYDALLTHPKAASPYDALLSHPAVSSPVAAAAPAASSGVGSQDIVAPEGSFASQITGAKPAVEKSAPLLEQAKAIPSTARQTLAETGLRTAAGEESFRGSVLSGEERLKAMYEPNFAKAENEFTNPMVGMPVSKARIKEVKDAASKAGASAVESAKGFQEDADAASEGQPKGALTTITKGLTKGAAMAAEAAVGGIPLMATQGATEAYGAAKSAGKSDEEADTDAAKTLIGLAIFGGANKVVSSGITKLLGANPQALRTFLIQSLGQSAGNEATSRVISAGEAALSAPPGKRLEAAAKAAKEFNLEATAQNIGFGVMGGAHSAGEETARIAETKQGAGPVVGPNEFESIPDDQFDAAIQQFKKLPDSDPRKSAFEAEIARRSALVQQGATETSTPTAPETEATQPPSQVQQVPLSEGVASEENDPKAVFKQRRKAAMDALAEKANEAAKNPDTQQAAKAVADSVPIIEQKGGETVEKEQTEKRKEEGVLTPPPASEEVLPPSDLSSTKELKYTIPERAVGPVIEDIRPSNEIDVRRAMQSAEGRVSTKLQTVPIESLSGGVRTSDPSERAKIDALKSKMKGEGGYIERIIADENGDVFEGQHRLEALREMGIKNVPITRISESSSSLPRPEEIASSLKGIRKEQAQQMVDNIAEIVSSEGVAALDEYEPTRGYEAQWKSAVDQVKQQLAPVPVIDETVYHSTAHPGNLETEGIERTAATKGSTGIYTTPEREDAEGWGGPEAKVRRLRVKMFKPFDVRDVPLDQSMTKEQLAETLRAEGLDVQAADIPGEDRTMTFDEWKPEIEGLTGRMRDAGFDGYVTKTTVDGKPIVEHVPFDTKALTPEEEPKAKSFREQVNESAGRVGEEGKFGRKVFINKAYEQFAKDTGSKMSLNEFKAALMDDASKGGTELSRNDFWNTSDKHHMANKDASEMYRGDEKYHFIVPEESQSGAVESLTATAEEPIAAKKAPAEVVSSVEGERPAESPTRIVGPAIRGEDGTIIAKGKIGDNHGKLKTDEIAKGNVEAADAEHVFHDEKGNILTRQEAAQRALAAGQITREQFDAAMRRGGTPRTEHLKGLHSEDLTKEETKADTPIEDHISSMLSLLGDKEPESKPEPEPTATPEVRQQRTAEETIALLREELKTAPQRDKKGIRERIAKLESNPAAAKPDPAEEPASTGNDTLDEMLRKEALFLKATEAKQGPKELWQQTRAEAEAEGKKGFTHMTAVKEAVKRGEAVPPEVLKDFSRYSWAREGKLTVKTEKLSKGLMGLIEALKELPEEGEKPKRAKKGQEGSTVIPTEIAERVFSAGKFAYEKGMDAAAWAARMVKAFGEKIRPFLADAWYRIVEWNKQKGERGAIGATGDSERKMGAERQAFVDSVGKAPLRAALMAGKEMHAAGFENPDVIKRMMDVFRAQMGEKTFDESAARRFFDPSAEVAPPKGESPKTSEAKALPRYDDPGESPRKPSPSPSPKGDTTALKKAVVNEQRQQRVEPEIPTPVRQSDEAMIDDARKRMSEDPTAAETVISRIVDRGQKGITREDAALILAQRRATVNERNHWEDIAGSGTDAERLMARSKLDEIETRMDRLDHASRAAGSEWSDVGRMYQADLRADYSWEALERKARVKTGRPLSREESATIKEQAETIAKLQAEAAAKAKEHQEALENSEVTHAYEETIKDLRKQLVEKGKPQPKQGEAKAPLSKRIVQFVESQMDAARQRIKDRKGKMFADPLGVMSAIDLADHALIGAGHIVKGVVKFADWSREMMKEFGKEIQPHLEPIYNAAKEQAKVLMKQAREKTPAEAKAAAKADAFAGEELSGKTVAALVRAHILDGVHGEDAVMKAVHSDIREAYPDATERDVRRAYSDYGKVRFPSREAVATEMRELRVLTRLQESIDRETEGLSALHTGLQRDKATQSIRGKQKTLNELLKKRSGDPSPEQLASRDEAKQTALRNAIADFDKQLRTGEKPAERVLVADSPATEQLRAERDAMREKLAEIESEANPPKSASQKQIEQLSKIRSRLDDILSGKKDKAKAPDWNPLSAEAETIRSEIDAMRELAAEMRPSSDAAQIKALEKSIDEYARRTAAKDFEPKGKEVGTDSARVTALKEVRDSRRSMYEAVKKAGEPIRTPEEIYNARRMTQVQKQIAEAESRIKAGDFAPRPKPVPKAKFSATAKAEADLAAKKREITQGFERMKYESRSIPQKRLDDLKNALRFITAVKIIGHGTVGMVTHAGGLIWRPTKATTYWRNFGRQFGMWANKGFHERLIYELKNDPEFETWKNAGASIDPERTYTDYGLYAKWLGKLTAGGERGFDALKLTRLELNKSDWKRVSPEIKADPEASAEMRKAIAAMNNKATGAIPRVNPLAKEAESGMHNLAKNPLADVALFAPKLYASRWARGVFDPVKTVKTFADWKSSSPAERQTATIKLRNAAEFAAVYAGGLLLNQAILSAAGAQQNVNFKDPTKSDWLKFKGGGKEVIADGGLLDPIRLIGQVVWGDLIKNRTSNERYREGTRYEKVTHDLARYVRGKLNPTLGLAVDSATGSDFQGRPLPFSNEPPKFKDQPKFEWGEWLLKQGPIPLSGGVQIAYDAMREKGLSKPQIMDILKGAAVALAGLTGAHISDEPKPSKQKPPRRSMVFSQ